MVLIEDGGDETRVPTPRFVRWAGIAAVLVALTVIGLVTAGLVGRAVDQLPWNQAAAAIIPTVALDGRTARAKADTDLSDGAVVDYAFWPEGGRLAGPQVSADSPADPPILTATLPLALSGVAP